MNTISFGKMHIDLPKITVRDCLETPASMRISQCIKIGQMISTTGWNMRVSFIDMSLETGRESRSCRQSRFDDTSDKLGRMTRNVD